MELVDKIYAAKLCIDNNLLAIVKYSNEDDVGIFQGIGKETRLNEVIASLKNIYTPNPPTDEEIKELKEIDPDFEIPEIKEDDYFLEFVYVVNKLKNSYRRSTIPIKYLDITPIWANADDSL